MEEADASQSLSPSCKDDLSATGVSHESEKVPWKFREKMKGCWLTNDFSRHNNRHSLEKCGEYFDLGLGRHKLAGHKSHHASEDLISWQQPDNNSPLQTSYQASYSTSPNTTPHDQPTRRRFPKCHASGNPDATTATSTTTWFDNDKKHRTPNQVLVSSQEPYLPHNPWKYSYRPTNINSHLPSTKTVE
ncbi:uncharacterized protein LOC134186825 [Corticium candelabrum]|uniref:uncharacterized protein LOC134186825 n=1 Tax=Corticium candelabrum TaxID=121492 RepID=UPI002E256719|nr:uncharacterized protein LOC134186825 [Corticium candelabrum]